MVDDLCMIHLQREDGTIEAQLSPWVEPMQLQTVAKMLWDKLPADAFEIQVEDVARIGTVTGVLAGYYASEVVLVATSTGVDESVIRKWFSEQLITPSRTRSRVLQGPNASQGLPNAVVEQLINAYLVRAEAQRGMIWYELAHDRLIDPILENNAAWFQAHQRQPLRWPWFRGKAR